MSGAWPAGSGGKRHSEPAREREAITHHGQHVAVHVLRSRRAVSDFLDGVDADRAIVDDGSSVLADSTPNADR
jgi:hypothetical protein